MWICGFRVEKLDHVRRSPRLLRLGHRRGDHGALPLGEIGNRAAKGWRQQSCSHSRFSGSSKRAIQAWFSWQLWSG